LPGRRERIPSDGCRRVDRRGRPAGVRLSDPRPVPARERPARGYPGPTMSRIALLAGGDGWHVRDLRRAAEALGHTAAVVDFRRAHAGVGLDFDALAGCDAIVVRTM